MNNHHRKRRMPLALGFAAAFLLLPGPVGAAPKYKQKVTVRAIIQFKQVQDGPTLVADLLEGLDYSKNPAPYTDTQAGSIKVGIFARKDTDGTIKNLRYDSKVLYPDELQMSDGTFRRCDKPEIRFLIKSVKLMRKGIWYEDLQGMYQRKLKACKNERDKDLKRRRFSRLFNWCNANYLIKEADKIAKELKRIEEPEMEVERIERPEFDPEERNRKIAEAFKALPQAGEVIVRSSPHIVIASDCLPEKTILHLLQLGERVYKDFAEFMYDPSLTGAKPLPDEEILRTFSFTHFETFKAALQNASTLSRCGNVRSKRELERTLKLGGTNFQSMVKKKVLRTSMVSCEKGDPNDPNSIQETHRDSNDHLVHQMGHTLLGNRLRANLVIGGPRPVMPWLEEGMAIYLTIKHLGSKNTACVDFPETVSRYAPQGKKEKKGFESWFGDVEKMVNQVALDDSADRFEDMVRVPAFAKMKPQTVAKAFSMIDFLVENDRVGFLVFMDSLQKHYKVLYKGHDLQAFIRGLDSLIADSFQGIAIKKGREVNRLDSVKALEEAWKDWASNYVMKRTPKR